MLCKDLCQEEERQKKFDPTMEGTLSKEKRSCVKQSSNGTSRRLTNRCCRRTSSGYSTHQQVPTTGEYGKDALGR